ncbi:hypothetical protein E2C01_024879 [Portunus trituberculatus]|uniref:Uncharacterized protein n=1 Tax=Portunus trituberculatus TaxID=210409 RepID=A0A5B7EE01_PORTR|nr:hypothetical protein [Portunus trituberculatus]
MTKQGNRIVTNAYKTKCSQIWKSQMPQPYWQTSKRRMSRQTNDTSPKTCTSKLNSKIKLISMPSLLYPKEEVLTKAEHLAITCVARCPNGHHHHRHHDDDACDGSSTQVV